MGSFSKCLTAALSLVLLAGCTKLELLDLTIPRYGYGQKMDVAYAKLPRQKLDIYMPENPAGEPAPVIVFFYGGAWQRGKKEDYRFVGESLASKGYVTVIADYRLYPEVTFPGFIEDSARATAWVHHHIGEYGGDPRNLYLAGHSAGAYNAMMLALDPRFLKAAGGSRSWVRGVIGLSGPYHFLPAKHDTINAIFASATMRMTQPDMLALRQGERLPDIMLATGMNDTLVVPLNTEMLEKRLKSAGIKVETHYYAETDHATVAQALASPFVQLRPVLADITRFIERTRK